MKEEAATTAVLLLSSCFSAAETAVEARATADAAVTLSGLSSSYSSVDADADKLLKSGARIQPVN